MAAGVAGTPDADAVRIDLRKRLEKGNGPPPIGDLAPRVDIVTDGSVAGSKVPVVMQQDDETGFRKGSGEALQPMLLNASVAMCHRNGGARARAGLRSKQPASQAIAALDLEFYVRPLNHDFLRGERICGRCQCLYWPSSHRRMLLTVSW